MEKYIHFTKFNIEKIESIFKYGIRTPFNLMFNRMCKVEHNNTHNGLFYTSLTKENNSKKSIYEIFSSSPYYIGIEVEIKKAYSTNKYGIFSNTPLPIRYSPYDDEWHTNKTIKPENFTAIYIPLELAKEKCNETEYQEMIKRLEQLKELIKLYDIKAPLIDKKVYTK